MHMLDARNAVNARDALRHVCADFHADDADLPAACALISPEQVPPPYDQLLVHREHMTTTLGGFFGQAVKLGVLRQRTDDRIYAREITLTLPSDGRVVEYGIARIHLDAVPPSARDEILTQQTPLGDILIARNMLRTITPRWFLRLNPTDTLERILGAEVRAAYGRIGVIELSGRTAIELLEIVLNADEAE